MKHRVKLTRGEIVLPRRIAADPVKRAQMEAWNAEGLKARNMGGVVAYREAGGAVGTEKQGFGDWAKDNSDSINSLGASLVSIGQRDFKGASDALATKEVDKAGQKAAAKELKSQAERVEAIKQAIDEATKAKAYIDAGAGVVIDYRAKNYSSLAADALSSFNPTQLLALGTSLTGSTAESVDRLLQSKFQGTKEWNAFQLFTQAIKLLEVKARSLVKGGSISDGEAKAAADTIATGKADAATTKLQLDTVIERNNASLVNEGESPYVSSATAHAVPGDGYSPSEEEADSGIDIGADETIAAEAPAPTDLKAGMKFDSASATGDWEYTVVERSGKAYVATSVGEYELFYNESAKTYYVKNSIGTVTTLQFAG